MSAPDPQTKGTDPVEEVRVEAGDEFREVGSDESVGFARRWVRVQLMCGESRVHVERWCSSGPLIWEDTVDLAWLLNPFRWRRVKSR